MQRWHAPPSTPSVLLMKLHAELLCALALVASGRGPARVPACELTLQHAAYPRAQRDGGAPDCGPVVAHALSLFGAGELRALHAGHANVFGAILAMLAGQGGGSAAAESPILAQALNSLRSVQLEGLSEGKEDEVHAAAIIARCAATVTELKGHLPGHLLSQSDGATGQPPVLARCTRLEVLTHASDYTPAVWLGLSQLHTLYDVDLGKVSTAAIAAALPRLRTLTTRFNRDARDDSASAAVTGFFTDLLPRLRVFHFWGTWPVTPGAETASVVAPPPAPALPLPLLEELVWHELNPRMTVLREFLGARPTILACPYELIAECRLADVDAGSRGGGTPSSGAVDGTTLLTRVCRLVVFGVNPLDLADVAHVLKGAPQLRAFSTARRLSGDTKWLTMSTARLNPAFVGLVHPKLRHLAVGTVSHVAAAKCDADCATRLRRTCFPRLQGIEVNGAAFFVTTPDAI
jgi:hypothetical protein